MSTFIRLLTLIGAAAFASAPSCSFAASEPTFEQKIAAVAERVSLMPRAVQPTLAQLQTDYAPLSVQHQAHIYEQMGNAKFYSSDFQGTLGYGVLLEKLGKESNDKSVECLGLLYQAFGNWKLGKIQAAYALVHQARRFPWDALSTSVQVRTLLTIAQMEAEERFVDQALQGAADAVALATSAKDSSMLFNATQMQAMVALSLGRHTVAQAAMNQLLQQSQHSKYPERIIRAKGVEFAVTSAAAMTARASQALVDRLRLVRAFQLTEALAGTLVDFADLQLKSKRYAESAVLSEEALQQASIRYDARLLNLAHFNHGIANIYLGKIKEGKAEVERLFVSNQERAQLLTFLPEYTAVLTQAGDANASVQAGAIRRRLEFEEELRRAKIIEKANVQQEGLAHKSQLKTIEGASEPGPRPLGLIFAACAVVGLIGLLGLYVRRLFLGKRRISAKR